LLLLLLQFLRGRQQRPEFTYPDPAGGPNKTVSFADILVASGVSVIKMCSKGRVIIPYTAGRIDATVADDTQLPSPTGVIEQKHFEIFQNMVSDVVTSGDGPMVKTACYMLLGSTTVGRCSWQVSTQGFQYLLIQSRSRAHDDQPFMWRHVQPF
jgi:hypothetical protein